MKNITLSLDEKELEAGRKYAQEHGLSLNVLIRQLLRKITNKLSKDWLNRCFSTMDQTAKANKRLPRWRREDLDNSGQLIRGIMVMNPLTETQ